MGVEMSSVKAQNGLEELGDTVGDGQWGGSKHGVVWRGGA